MNTAKITTVIPTYRRPEFLKKAIQSALDQTFPDLRVLVCDNASGDETKEVVASFAERDPRVSYFCQPNHVPILDNFEKGLSLVQTPLYSILCDDDFLFPWFYEIAITELNNNPKAMMFCGGTLVINERREICQEARLMHDGIWDISSSPIEQMKSVIMQIVLPACVFRKGDHEYTPRMNPKAGWDQTMTWNVVLNHPIIACSKFVVGYRKHPKQESIQDTGYYYLNEDKFKHLIKNEQNNSISKLRYTDDIGIKWKLCLKMALSRNSEGTAFAFSVVKRHSKLQAALLFAFINLCKINGFHKLLSKIYQKLLNTKKTSETAFPKTEFSELIKKYTFSIH